jgi:hypothetical protein
MKRLTLTVVAVLLAVPALAHAKAGVEFDQNIEAQKPGSQQSFTAFVHGAGGGPPSVSFQNTRTGKVIRVKTVRTDEPGIGRGTVAFPDRGPWVVTMSVNGHPVADMVHGEGFELGAAPKVRVMGTMEPPADPPAAATSDGGFPFWLLMLPAAGLVAAAIWFARRRPREIGT